MVKSLSLEEDEREKFPLEWYHPQYFDAFNYMKDLLLNIDSSYFAYSEKIQWDKFDIYSTISFTPDEKSDI